MRPTLSGHFSNKQMGKACRDIKSMILDLHLPKFQRKLIVVFSELWSSHTISEDITTSQLGHWSCRYSLLVSVSSSWQFFQVFDSMTYFRSLWSLICAKKSSEKIDCSKAIWLLVVIAITKTPAILGKSSTYVGQKMGRSVASGYHLERSTQPWELAMLRPCAMYDSDEMWSMDIIIVNNSSNGYLKTSKNYLVGGLEHFLFSHILGF